MPRRTFLVATLLAAFLTPAAPAIITRHDVPDAYYRAAGEQYRATVVDVAVPGEDGVPKRGNGAGTLVEADWVLTAAHIASRIMPGHERSRVNERHAIYVNGSPYRVERVVLHPDWTIRSNYPDIALLKLEKPVQGGQPACLYPANDELGQVAVVAGYGRTGTGLTGPVGQIGILRAASVRVEGVEPDGSMLWWRFKAPGDRLTTRLQGISGPGDSGGPVLLRHRDRVCVAGVSSLQDEGDHGEGRYGVRELYPRVSYFRKWLQTALRS